MKRNGLNTLKNWNSSRNRKPLVVWGARQVGKTYLIKELFAKEWYKNSFIYIDLNNDSDYRDFFKTTCNPKEMIHYIESREGMRINGNTLLIFDEIQACLNVLVSLKYFCQDYREIPVIATGSLVRTKMMRDKKEIDETFLFPVGKINELNLYPLTFDEYLMNANEILYEKVLESYQSGNALNDAIHKLAMNYFYDYLLIGGMPEAVKEYLETESTLEAKDTLNSIYNNYLADMALYQISDESLLKTRDVYKNIYKQLNKEAKNFSPGLIKKGAKNRDYRSPIDWLLEANVVYKSSQLKEHVTPPLNGNDDSNFRLYLADMGLFTYQSGINATTFISDKRNTLAGIFFENYVAVELEARNVGLYFWRGKRSNELEFIIYSNGQLIPIDVKKGNAKLNSLEEFSNHNKYDFAIKISNNNAGYDKEKRLLTIPFYFTSFLAEDLANGSEIAFIHE